MITFQELIHCDGRTPRRHFLRNVLLLAIGKAVIDLQVMYLRPDLARDWSWPMSWLNPCHLIGPWLHGQIAFLICLTTLLFFAAVVWNAVHRARDAGWPTWIATLTALPFVHVFVIIALALPTTKRRSVWDII